MGVRVKHFWVAIEELHPGQQGLRIAPDLYNRWRETIRLKDDGTHRRGQDDIVISVRSFYYDLHTWAADEPERWAAWVAPCPVPLASSTAWAVGDARKTNGPLTAPASANHSCRSSSSTSNSATTRPGCCSNEQTRPPTDEEFTHCGTAYRRVISESDHKLLRHGAPVPTRVVNLDTGVLMHIGAEEEAAFWDWAAVETLRHSGVRIEELCELTHLGIRQYQRSNGEVIALLVIAPSKTDRERVIPMSAELFHVVASIIRRHSRRGKPIPLVSRHDHHEKVWSAPMPFLFQRQNGAIGSKVFNPGTIQKMISLRCEDLARTRPGFRGLKFTPHDFRRIFATELVNSGLPIHIGAALLGHLSIQTTRGYVAVFDEDVVRHYQAHLHQGRQVRPSEEYRDTTEQEWTEFEEHFDRRKVELGSCGRPYGTPCQHEHACIRCPMLHVNPKMLARLFELEADLLQRRTQAEAEGWIGEIEGIDLTLTFLRAKRDETQRRAERPAVHLGIPARRRPNEAQ